MSGNGEPRTGAGAGGVERRVYPPPVDLPPPVTEVGPLGWLKANLFGSVGSAVLTVAALVIAYLVLRPVLTWALTSERWGVIPANLRLFMIGRYPSGLEWRPWTALYLAALLIGLTFGLRARSRSARTTGMALLAVAPLLALLIRGQVWWAILLVDGAALAGAALALLPQRVAVRVAVVGWLAFFPLVVLLLLGFGEQGLFAAVGTNLWSGLLLTLLLASIGIIISFPIGVALALGRQSEMPIVQNFCVFYIELIRGVPLITILFMMQVMLPLFLPQGATVDRIIRAIVGFVIFTAAYIAENVRGGLQAIPRGQYEAAFAVGLTPIQTTMKVVLPQAIRISIPVLVNQFISLFKDTTLVSIVGLLDLLGIANAMLANPRYLGSQPEVYLFVGGLFWVFSYAMSAGSRRIEKALRQGDR